MLAVFVGVVAAQLRAGSFLLLCGARHDRDEDEFLLWEWLEEKVQEVGGVKEKEEWQQGGRKRIEQANKPYWRDTELLCKVRFNQSTHHALFVEGKMGVKMSGSWTQKLK
jgi:hypothetical protein